MEEGARQLPPEYLREIREPSQEEFPNLLKSYQELEHPEDFPVEPKPDFRKCSSRLSKGLKRGNWQRVRIYFTRFCLNTPFTLFAFIGSDIYL
jgi:hypothetical protein